ncbi:Clp protease N-terminal domain-containing protein [Streptomyces hayashii]|uniref:Clp protease N-terminal domain-containing protein n=1 Tax=Streptomyces hayashii TaxID=2839966 RepID=UPI00403D16AF
MAKEFTQGRPSGPTVALTPRLRCPHGAGDAVREADDALLTGRSTRALDAYLRILAGHPRAGFCDRALHARAAEAALAARCPQIAHDLVYAVVRRSGGRPVGAEAVLTARALALRARALLDLGRTEEAAAALRRAQSTTQRDRAVDLLVRLSAAQVQLAQEAPFDDWDNATHRLTSMLARHRLNPEQPGVLPPLLVDVGRMFLRQGDLEPACEAFDMAARHTAVTGWTGRKGILAVGDQHPEDDRRWRYAAAHWAEALCEEAHCRAVSGGEGPECHDGEARLVFGLAAASAEKRGDAETAARLSACRTYLQESAENGRGVWAVPREPEAVFLFLFADRVAQRRWAALHDGVDGIRLLHTSTWSAPDEADPPQLAWWVARSDPRRLRDAARAADELFTRLNASAPETFGALRDTVRLTIGALQTLMGGEPIVAAGQSPRLAAAAADTAEPVPSEGGAQAGSHARSARGRKRRPPAEEPDRGPGALKLPDAVPSPYKDMTAVVPHGERPQPGAFARPPWLDDVTRTTGAPCWTALTAAAEAHMLGHGHVGTEHLLLAAVEDSDCAELLRPLGVGPEAVRRCVTGLIGPDPDRPPAAPLSARARAVLALAGAQARRYDAVRIRPLHVLGALALDGRGVGAHILTTLGADRDEVLTRVRLHTAPDDPADPPTPAIDGLPPLVRFTTAARRTVARAGVRAGASAGALLDPVLLLRALAAEGWGQAQNLPQDLDDLVRPAVDGTPEAEDAWPVVRLRGAAAALRVGLTPGARRILVTATADSGRRGHPGVDVDHLARAIVGDLTPSAAPGVPANPGTDEDVPPPDDDVRRVLDAAHTSAIGSGHPYIGPEHLAVALAAEGTAAGPVAPAPSRTEGPNGPGSHRPHERRRPAVPLPLTPRAAEALAAAGATARAAGRATATAADLRQELARVAPRPASAPPPSGTSSTAHEPADDEATDDTAATGRRFHPELLRYLVRAQDVHQQLSRLLSHAHAKDVDSAEYERRLRKAWDTEDERLEVLRLLCRNAPDRHAPSLIEGLVARARRRRDALAPAALDEAAHRSRRAALTHPEGTLRLARTLTEIGLVHQEAGRARAALTLYDEALHRLDTAPDRPPTAEREPDRAAGKGGTADPGASEDAIELRGWTLLQRAGCFAADGPEAETVALLRAFDHLRNRLATAPLAPHRSWTTEAVARIATRLGDLGRYDKALLVTSRVLATIGAADATLPELAVVHDERARALLVLNRGDLGRADLDSAVRLAPEDPFHLSRRGTHLLRTGRVDEAIADFDRALNLAPEYLFPRRRRGEAHLRAGRYADALADLDAVLRDGRAPTAALLSRGQALRALGDAEAALRDVTAASAEDPECSWTRYQYALSLFATGSVDRARRQAGEAIRQGTASHRDLDPWRFTSAANLAVVHAALGARRQAHRWLKAAFNYRHHPWTIADFHDDLHDLARTVPERSPLCDGLSRAADELRATSTPLSTTVVERPGP